ncbi:hypothetical protein [Sphingomonas lycopersici]|uniref:Uncharacterized protein n=1 Tax=Sphingomonas lycopersici TaxID=2951807 RepID=A0AA42CWD2_9SPHN|nr:hypothetical protein [Sphingomonas lycopersici]MCW6537678.1 hypothetical protein [Sphingomonas lycopersici]
MDIDKLTRLLSIFAIEVIGANLGGGTLIARWDAFLPTGSDTQEKDGNAN